MVLNNTVAERIGYLREKAGLTQTDLAKILGVTRNAVSYWEMSLSNPSLANVVAMAKLFNVSTDYILALSDKELIDITDLTFEQKEVIYKTVALFKKDNKN